MNRVFTRIAHCSALCLPNANPSIFQQQQGRSEYREMDNGVQIADLYQNPDSRPRRGTLHVPTLTTGCARMWLFGLHRYASGAELLALHGIPVFRKIAEAMGCMQVQVRHVSHRCMCRLAGNSMHSSCVGLCFVAVLNFTK